MSITRLPLSFIPCGTTEKQGKRLLYLQNRFKAGKRRADPRPERTVTILNNPTFSGVPLEERIPSDKR